MKSRGQVAARIAEDKRLRPHLYCRAPKCLWKTTLRDGIQSPCRKHPLPQPAPEKVQVWTWEQGAPPSDRCYVEFENELVEWGEMTQADRKAFLAGGSYPL